MPGEESKHKREKPSARYSSESQHTGAQSTFQSQGTSQGHPQSSTPSSTHSSPQVIVQTPAATAQPSAGKPRSMGATFLLPLVIVAVLFLGTGMFGKGCMTVSDTDYGFGGAGGSTYSTADNTPAYQISDSLGTGNEGDSWTVLMYLCGSDLESTSVRLGGGQATQNLIELAKANLGTNVNYVIETGGAKKWQNDVVQSRYLCRYTMEQGALALKDRQPSASMAEGSTFADFLKWGVNAYPADHYMVLIWDHGGGTITGVCQDDIYPTNSRGQSDSLTLVEMRDAMKDTGVTFDVVGFDTCLMATLETANILSPYAKYMVASEESEPGSGWDYVTWPTWLGSHPGTTGADLGTVICQSYYNKCRNSGQAGMATLSVIDLAKVGKVASAFEKAAGDLARATVDPASLRRLHQGARSTENYGASGFYSMNMVDLGDLMNKTGGVIGKDSATVLSALKDAVVFETHGRNRSSASGLSVYYPLQITDRNDFKRYAELSDNIPYLQFLAVMFGVYDNYNWNNFSNAVSLTDDPMVEDDMGIEYVQSKTSDGHLALQITEGAEKIASVSFELYAYLDPLDILCYLGSDNDLSGSYESGTFVDNFQNEWLTIDGHYVSPTLSEEGDGYNLYYIPVMLNSRQTGLIVEYDYATDEYSVLCVWDDASTTSGMAGKTGQLLQEGDTIQFLFPASNATTGASDVIPLETMQWHEDATIAYAGLGDGTFAYRYRITNVLGNVQETDLVYQKFENGRPVS